MKVFVAAALCLSSCLLSFAEELKPAPLLTPDETREIGTIVTALLAAGFPDTEHAKVHLGKLHAKATFDPAKSVPPLPSWASKMQMSTPSGAMTYGYEFDGLHFELSDGSWLIAEAYHFRPKGGDSVNADDAPIVDLATLNADAAKAHPFDAEKSAKGWLEMIAPAQRTRAKDGMNRLVPVSMQLKLNADGLAPAAILLYRAGYPDSAALSLAIADQRARNYWQLRPWTNPDVPFDPTGVYPKSKEEEAAWRRAHTQLTSEPPALALRRALYRWFHAQLTVENPEDALLPSKAAAACAKAVLDPKDALVFGPHIDALAAGIRLPVTPAKGADLAARLQSWEARARKPKMVVSGGDGGLSMSTSFEAPAPAYEPQKSDLDGLVALLADERPSRFWDFSGPRTLGDNAWRALAKLLNADPRTLAKHPADRSWTPAERRAAAADVQNWWKEHRKEYVEAPK